MTLTAHDCAKAAREKQARDMDRKAQLRAAVALVTCNVGPCCRILGHKGNHGDSGERYEDNTATGQTASTPTRVTILALRSIVADLEDELHREQFPIKEPR